MEYLITAVLREKSGNELRAVKERASRLSSFIDGSWYDGNYSARFRTQHGAFEYISWLIGNNHASRVSIEPK